MIELHIVLDTQVNVQNESLFRGSRKLPQAHEKCTSQKCQNYPTLITLYIYMETNHIEDINKFSCDYKTLIVVFLFYSS